MAKLRVLIVDDAVVVRKIITDALMQEAEIEVAGSAPNGKLALAKIPLLSPDLVLTDLEMPEMDGLELTREIKRLYPKIPIIIFSGTSADAAQLTLDALRLGASDFIAKPTGMANLATAVASVRSELAPRIRALVGKRAASNPSASAAKPTLPGAVAPAPSLVPSDSGSGSRVAVSLRLPGPARRIDAVVIGVSTGGPNALLEVIPKLPKNLPVPVLVVQHMPPTFTKLLAERLSQSGGLPVVEAASGMLITPGKVWIAPGDYHLTVSMQPGQPVMTRLDQNTPENSCRPAVDPLFRSAITVWSNRILAVIMTGMGQDGLKGSEAVVAAGGSLIAQDEATSVVWGMPGAVARAGLCERLLPLAGLAPEIARRAMIGRSGPGATAP